MAKEKKYPNGMNQAEYEKYLNTQIEGKAVSRQKIWDTTSKKLRETFIHYSLVSSVHI